MADQAKKNNPTGQTNPPQTQGATGQAAGGGTPVPPPAGNSQSQTNPPAGAYPPGGFPPASYPPAGAYPPAGYPPASASGASAYTNYPQSQNPPYPGPTQPPGQNPGGYFQPAGGYPPAGAYTPPGAYPPAGYPPQPEDTTPANFQLGVKFPPKLKIKVPKHTLKFDEEYFIRLLAGSISLSKDEKKKIVDSVPKLKQAQIDELIRIFEEEKQKFAALSKKHVPQLEKLAQQHYLEWMALEDEYEQGHKKAEDQGKADAIRKSLGL